MPQTTLTKPASRDLPKAGVPSPPRATEISPDAISRKNVADESREDVSKSLTPDEIRARAYEIYVESGYEEGRADAHWLAAERELLAESHLQTIKKAPGEMSQ